MIEKSTGNVLEIQNVEAEQYQTRKTTDNLLMPAKQKTITTRLREQMLRYR